MKSTLHVFALNEPVSVRHTDLTRSRGEAPDLPPLHDWIGVGAIDTDRIELFSVKDLGDMALDRYLVSAHDVEEGAVEPVAGRLRALDGAVLIAPDTALDGSPAPGPEATQIAELPVARADHRADLSTGGAPQAPLGTPEPEPLPEPKPGVTRNAALVAGIALAVAALLVVILT